MSVAVDEIRAGRRFEFGKNWRRYLAVLDDQCIFAAERSLQEILDCDSLSGRRFLDVGSGSGLFSLAARRCGAHVHSLDYDPESVACAIDLKQRFFPSDLFWTIEEGSILNLDYVNSLPKFDIVYSWGVLHHTAALWQALENVRLPVALGGLLCIAIYNDQGMRSELWKIVKQVYCSGRMGRSAVLAVFLPYFFFACLLSDALKGANPLQRYREYKQVRGMSIVTDWLDWLGGYPFEVAKPEAVVSFYEKRGFVLRKMNRCGDSNGNNQFIFQRME